AGVLDDWNRSFGRLTGYASEESIGRHIGFLCADPAAAREATDALLESAARDGSVETEGWRMRKDDSRIWADTLITPLRGTDGEIDGYAFLTRDISGRKQMEEGLREAANTDFLTGAFNRRHLENTGAREFARHRSEGKPLSLVMFDADHFKRVNDTHGHDAGDKVLVALSRTAAALVRRADVFARAGGEEFVLLLPETPLDGAAALAEKLRIRIKALEVEHAGAPIRFTCSFGVAAGADAASFDELVQHADQAMYQAKSEGRDKVCVFMPTGTAAA
ncbi:MAG: sensor domain-containing diguanylate cyclase, partial [Hyphomicrobium sp.]|nr:sensor domain-containing diguanylate cyclase [Hyphomicrobium sp.]